MQLVKKGGIQSKNQPLHKHTSSHLQRLFRSFSMSFKREGSLLRRGRRRIHWLATAERQAFQTPPTAESLHSEWLRRDTWPQYPVTVSKKGLTSPLPTSKPFFGRQCLAFVWLISKYPFRSTYLLTLGHTFLPHILEELAGNYTT